MTKKILTTTLLISSFAIASAQEAGRVMMYKTDGDAAVTVTSASSQGRAVAGVVSARAMPAMMEMGKPIIMTGDAKIDAELKVMHDEMEAKIKAIRDEYQKQVKAKVGTKNVTFTVSNTMPATAAVRAVPANAHNVMIRTTGGAAGSMVTQDGTITVQAVDMGAEGEGHPMMMHVSGESRLLPGDSSSPVFGFFRRLFER